MWNPLHTHWWDYLSVAVYATHFFAWVTTAALLWHFNRDAFKRFVPQLLILTGLGFATYVLYPAVPPWLANFQGHLDGVTRIVPAMWNVSGVHTAAALFESGNHYSNDVAAVPSLHAGYACLIGLFLWPMAGPRVRVLLAAYVLMMGFALVYLGEHFLIDVFLGWLYAGAAVLISNRIRRARRARLARSAQSARSAPALPLVQLDVAPVAQ
jgi:membrane-associated phospholipid phosphatase